MRNSAATGNGFTLIELMIAVVIIGLLMAIAIPAYRDYISSVQRTKVAVLFDEAVKFANHEYFKEKFELSVGNASSRPSTAAGWAAALNKSSAQAPGGGASFITNNTGDPVTGAVGVATIDSGATLVLARPPYHELSAVTATITSSSTVLYDESTGAAGKGKSRKSKKSKKSGKSKRKSTKSRKSRRK